jgi:hypothetical protein|tara:strand:+ start:3849 stop:4145 length:297 start_codon:yes stop_codon:yes gene_type:complete
MTLAAFDLPRKDAVVSVRTTSNRGFNPDELAEQCVEKIISISDSAHPAIQEQAKAFSRHVETVIAYYLRQAIHSDRTTVYNAIKDAGNPELAELIRRL